MIWHIGCSGFHYKDWKDVLYPTGLPQKKWFEFYSSQFDSLELNVTFYRFPQVSFLENWYNKSPEDFRFSVKAPRLITHYKQFTDCDSLLEDFYSIVQQGLKHKLGTVLFQFPPKFTYTAERLEKIIKSLNPGVKNVVEFRHPGWWGADIYKKLKKSGIIFSGISHPLLPDKIIVNNPVAYYRFHGSPRLYYSAYENSFLKKIASQFAKDKTVTEVYIFFNNTATMAAIENAGWIREYIRQIEYP